MRVLVFGAQGMLGREVVRELSRRDVDVVGTTKDTADAIDESLRPVVANIDVQYAEDIYRAIDSVRPNVAINCVGIVKSECDAAGLKRVWSVNAAAPVIMADAMHTTGGRLIHISTDCVFSGRKGDYFEGDSPDPGDLYGQSKAAGEPIRWPNALTLRTSFIGHDKRRHRGLLEWLVARGSGTVPGWTRALWSGLSAQELSRAIALALSKPELSGLYHVAGLRISKADLIATLADKLHLECRIERVDGESIDRTLDGAAFSETTGYRPPSWSEMAEELAHA